jgi:hypothetical protein
MDSTIKKQLPWVVLAAVIGAIAFALGQKLAGFPQTIPEFMGQAIVSGGGYSPSLALPIGWGVHLGVALSYAVLFSAIAALPAFRRGGSTRFALLIGLVFVLGWVSTLITQPAIGITIGVLSGQGFPAALPPLNKSLGFVFWNHVAFFAIVLLVTQVVPSLVGRGSHSAAMVQNAAWPNGA